MESTAYIDITGERQIDGLLADPDALVVEAFALETLDGWVPDTGLTPYARRSIFRPALHGAAPAVIRHRFWDSVDGRIPVLGTRYLGVVLYAAANQPCPLEFQLSSDILGCIVPQRLDNRRHLLVLDRPVPFQGGLEVLQIRTLATGPYRLESLVLLAERPVVSAVPFAVSQLSVRWSPDRNGYAELRCVTSVPAYLHARCIGPDATLFDEQSSTQAQTIHAIDFARLDQQTGWRFELTLTSLYDEVAHSALNLVPKATPPSNTALMVALELPELPPADLPLTFGLPLPPGHIFQNPPALLQSATEQIRAQTRVHVRWPDGSARWLLVDTRAPKAVGQVNVQLGAACSFPQLALSYARQEQALVVESEWLRVTVDEQASIVPALIERRDRYGLWQPLQGLSDERPPRGEVHVVLADGTTLTNSKLYDLELEEQGPERAVLRYYIDHYDATGVVVGRSTFRIHIYAAMAALRILHRFEIHDQPTAAQPEANGLVSIATLSIAIPLPAISRVQHGEEDWSLAAGAAWELRHNHDQAYVRAGHDYQGRVPGHLLLWNGSAPVAIAVREFWQRAPTSIRVQPTELNIDVLPALDSQPWPGDSDAAHRLYFWRDGAVYQLTVGMAVSSELLLGFPETAAEAQNWFAWFENPPIVRPTLAWLNQTGILPTIAPKSQPFQPRYETMVDAACDGWLADREQGHLYGFINFGDTYKPEVGGDHEMNMWENNEYDGPWCHLLEFLRGGKPEWFRLAAQATRHLIDIDTNNSPRIIQQRGGQYMHIQGHNGHYLPPFYKGSKMGFPAMQPSHTWVEGPALYYALTGDESVRETLAKTAQWLVQDGLNHYDFDNVRELGWHLIHLCALYELFADQQYLNAARLLVERALERQDTSGGWIRQLTESHCGCRPLRCQGEAGFMIGVLLSGLRRYHAISGDQRVAEALIRGARWLVATTYEPTMGHFRYTTCPQRGRGASPVYTYMVLEGLACAYRLSGDPQFGQIVACGFGTLGLPGDPHLYYEAGAGRPRVGKAFSSEARFAPLLLADYAAALNTQ